VGHKPDAVAAVRGTNGGRGYAIPFRIVPALGKVSEYSAHSPVKQRCDVLHNDVSRSNHANDSEKFGPESGPCAVDSFSLSGVADVLARESAAEHINVFNVGNGSDVSISFDVGPVFSKDSLTVVINLHLPHNLIPCTLKTKIEAANPGK
jgi:hypothetical protein